MQIFSSEFPVADGQSSDNFRDEARRWLEGARYSRVFSNGSTIDPTADLNVLRAVNGEELLLREVIGDKGPIAIGFRHDNPDPHGRLWRTEAVLRFKQEQTGSNLIRIRTLCIANQANAILEIPKKPYIIKGLLKAGWGGVDGEIDVSDSALYLEPNDEDLEFAAAVIGGKATRNLPVIYVSARSNEVHDLCDDLIEKLAYRLGGIAHVVVEPNRKFSFELRNRTEGKNVYGGSVGIYLPSSGLAARFYRSWQLPGERDLLDRVTAEAVAIRSRMPAEGLDWSELQEQALRQQRSSRGADADFAELEKIYLEEIKALKEQIDDYKANVETLNASLALKSDTGFESGQFVDSIAEAIGGEIYRGEIADRLRFAAQVALRNQDKEGIDKRSRATFEVLSATVSSSLGLKRFDSELERATKDKKGLADKVAALLAGHGFDAVTTNSHVKISPRDGLVGIGPITLPATSSDHRAPKNTRSQVRTELGLTRLDF